MTKPIVIRTDLRPQIEKEAKRRGMTISEFARYAIYKLLPETKSEAAKLARVSKGRPKG